MGAAYTNEQTEYVIAQYEKEPTRETVARLATELNKSERSITSKLSKEGVYKKKEYRAKDGTKPRTKEQLVEAIVAHTGCNEYRLAGLEKAPRLAIKEVADLLEVPLD